MEKKIIIRTTKFKILKLKKKLKIDFPNPRSNPIRRLNLYYNLWLGLGLEVGYRVP